MDNQDKRERLVQREVVYNISFLILKLMNKAEFLDDLSELCGEEDEEGNISEVYEYWIVTPWLAEKLKARGELVTEFYDLDIWGRQTAGQLISEDGIIDDIVKELYAS